MNARCSPLKSRAYTLRIRRADLLADNLGADAQAERVQIVAAYPRGPFFKERMIEAIGRGIASAVIDVRHVRRQPAGARRAGLCGTNYCGLILVPPMRRLVTARPRQSNELVEAMNLKQVAHGTSEVAREE